MRSLPLLLALLLSTPGPVVAQELPADSIKVEVDGAIAWLGRAALGGLPRESVTVAREGEPSRRFTGIPLRAILAAGGYAPGRLRGAALASSFRVGARDGYSVAFGVAELDSALVGHAILLAFAMDGAPLPMADGPWRLLIPSDHHGARWVRQVNSVSVEARPRQTAPAAGEH
jgi:DMSO/TMAO reductase YedYZ molybdopterin-dependent catalytic subunit